MHDQLVVIGAAQIRRGVQKVLGNAPAVGARLVRNEDHGCKIHAVFRNGVAGGRDDHALTHARVGVCDVARGLVREAGRVQCGFLKVVARLKRKPVEDGRLLLHHEVALPRVAMDGVRVDEAAVPQARVGNRNAVGFTLAVADVVVDQLGRQEEARHGNVIGRLVTDFGRTVGAVERGHVFVRVTVALGRARIGPVALVEPGA